MAQRVALPCDENVIPNQILRLLLRVVIKVFVYMFSKACRSVTVQAEKYGVFGL